MIDNIKDIIERLRIDTRDKYHVEMGDWFYNYRIKDDKDDWKLILTLTYNFKYKHDEQPIKKVNILLNKFISQGYKIESFYTTETDKSYNIHNHLILWFNCDIDTALKLIKKEWRTTGIIHHELYDNRKGWCWYITKFIKSNNQDNWGYVGNIDSDNEQIVV
jgi:hypothetical protein